MPRVEQALVLHISSQPTGFLEIAKPADRVSAYASLADDLGLRIDQVRGGLANLCYRKGHAEKYVTSSGAVRYWLTQDGRTRAAQLHVPDQAVADWPSLVGVAV